MAPEQLDGKHVEPAADVYAYGLMTYELFGGRQPWAGESLWSIVHRQKSEPLPDAARILSFVGDSAKAIALHQCISKDPLARPRNGIALLDAMGWGELNVEPDLAGLQNLQAFENQHTMRMDAAAMAKTAMYATPSPAREPIARMSSDTSAISETVAVSSPQERTPAPNGMSGRAVVLATVGVGLLMVVFFLAKRDQPPPAPAARQVDAAAALSPLSSGSNSNATAGTAAPAPSAVPPARASGAKPSAALASPPRIRSLTDALRARFLEARTRDYLDDAKHAETFRAIWNRRDLSESDREYFKKRFVSNCMAELQLDDNEKQ